MLRKASPQAACPPHPKDRPPTSSRFSAARRRSPARRALSRVRTVGTAGRSCGARREMDQRRVRCRYLFCHQWIRHGGFVAPSGRQARRMADVSLASRDQDCATLLAADDAENPRCPAALLAQDLTPHVVDLSSSLFKFHSAICGFRAVWQSPHCAMYS